MSLFFHFINILIEDFIPKLFDANNFRNHAKDCGSPIEIDNFTIIDAYPQNNLRILKSLHIHKN